MPSRRRRFMRGRLTGSGVNAFTAPFRWIIVTGAVFFISAGEISIPRAWIYTGIYSLGALVTGILLLRKSPELLNDRGRIKEGTVKSDRILLFSYFFIAVVVLPLVAGIDHRMQFSVMPFSYLYPGLFLYSAAALLSLLPMLHNRFFEGTLRIQKEKGHVVISSGPYRVIRHPGYLGMLLGAAVPSLAFGSTISLIPALLMVIIVIARTSLEDRTLKRELAGYEYYAREVSYRLVPGIW
ncbi:MAG: isoprenylcysteine carboxylmethyltransferase family protein [Candidatus Latescibacteria bacterium]|nr:isoprenylcysteine carboxylmethyltransferase family protein [bacterium]MBD3425188.1 isoprenylcysteine carboxylmethyltransferase family protein [Candidatus Latescibacterota bacterium]